LEALAERLLDFPYYWLKQVEIYFSIVLRKVLSPTGNQRLSRLNGNSLAKILPNCSQNSKINRRHSQEIRDRMNETMYEGPYHPSSPSNERRI